MPTYAPFVDLDFAPGTVIPSAWLNGVNDFILQWQGGGSTTSFTVANTIAALKAVDHTKFTTTFVAGYYAAHDGGGGMYTYDSTDTTSADNGGTIIVATDGARWKLSYTTSLSVKQFGAKGDGATDDTTAIMAAYSALGGVVGECTLFFPKGIYMYSTLTFDQAAGLRLVGEGAIYTTTLRNNNVSGATGGIKLRSSFDCALQFLTFDHVSGFSGYHLDVRHAPSVAIDTQGLWVDNCTFTSQGNNLYTAFGANLDQATIVHFNRCQFFSLARPIDGQDQGGASYSNVISFDRCQFADNVGYCFNFLGENWSISRCNFQASHNGMQQIAFSTAPQTWKALSFHDCGVYDTTTGGNSTLNLGAGKGLTIDGGTWGGLGSGSAMLNATGAILGLHVRGAWISLYTNVFVATAAGQQGWIIEGNRFESVGNVLSGLANIKGISMNGNSPNSSLVFGGSPSGYYINPNGLVHQYGWVACTGGASASVTFPYTMTAAPVGIQVSLQAPAVLTNTASFSGPSTSGMTVSVGGSGANTVYWEVIGTA